MCVGERRRAGATQHSGPVGQTEQGPELSPREALEAAYRFVARYYDSERCGPILRLLEAISVSLDDPEEEGEDLARWRSCVVETLDGSPLPALPPRWDS